MDYNAKETFSKYISEASDEQLLTLAYCLNNEDEWVDWCFDNIFPLINCSVLTEKETSMVVEQNDVVFNELIQLCDDGSIASLRRYNYSQNRISCHYCDKMLTKPIFSIVQEIAKGGDRKAAKEMPMLPCCIDCAKQLMVTVSRWPTNTAFIKDTDLSIEEILTSYKNQP